MTAAERRTMAHAEMDRRTMARIAEVDKQTRTTAAVAGTMVLVLAPTTLAALAPLVGLRWWHGLIAGGWLIAANSLVGLSRRRRAVAAALIAGREAIDAELERRETDR